MKTIIMFPGYGGFGMLVPEDLVGCFVECISKSTPVIATKVYDSDTSYEVTEDINDECLPHIRYVSDSRVKELEVETPEPEVEIDHDSLE